MFSRRPTAGCRPTFRRCAAFCTAGALCLLAALALPSNGRADDPLRADAMVLFISFWNTTAFLMACPSYVGENPPYLAAAEAWKKRHDPILERMAIVIERSGGLPVEDKQRIADAALQEAKTWLAARGDSGLYCFGLDDELDNGTFDFENQQEVAPALRRLMKADLG
ncbi:MAG: hypothetical protein QNJ30_05495 [Kiloniellales bacterium]|nr:hypothetical protein [Kiloniellales bacterium]